MWISGGCSRRRCSRTRRRTTRPSAAWFAAQRGESFPERMTMALERAQTLRYGENPDQRAAFYVEHAGDGLAALAQRGGKELSFNNLLDLEGALLATDPFGDEVACAIVKHTTPCGLADRARRARCVSQGARVRSGLGVRLRHLAHRSRGRRGGGSHLQSVRRVHRRPGVLRRRRRDSRAQEEPSRPRRARAAWPRRATDLKRVRGGLLVQERPSPAQRVRGVAGRHQARSRRTRSATTCCSRGAPSRR